MQRQRDTAHATRLTGRACAVAGRQARLATARLGSCIRPDCIQRLFRTAVERDRESRRAFLDEARKVMVLAVYGRRGGPETQTSRIG
jgi:hypothetical protein